MHVARVIVGRTSGQDRLRGLLASVWRRVGRGGGVPRMAACGLLGVMLFIAMVGCSVEEPVGEAEETAADTTGEGAGEADADAETETPAAADVSSDRVLRVAYTADTYRPERVGKWPLNTRIFDTLVNMNEDLELEPMLAVEWEHDIETNTYRFHLREDVLFHDGQEFTAADVKFTLDAAAEANPRNYQQLTTEGIRVVDDHTVEVTPGQRNNRLVEQLAHPSFGINRADSDPLEPVGTGPFRFVEYQPDEQIVVERFEDYWDPERAPGFAGIEFSFVDDAQTRVLALRSGELDVIADVPADATGEIEGVPGFTLARSGPAAFGRVDMNIAGVEPHDILQDPLVREAVARAVDREDLVETVYAGNADPDPLPSHLFGEHATAVEGVPHDPDTAEGLLDEAGWIVGDDGQRSKDGRALVLSYLPLSPTPDARLIGEVLQEQLAGVGIQVELDPAADPAITSSRREEGLYDLLHQGGSQNDANPCFLLDLLYYSPERGGRESNRFLAPGGAVDDAIDACREAETLDGAREHAAEAARLLIDEQHIYIPVGNAFRIWAMSEAIQGFVAHPGLGRANFEMLQVTD